MQSVRRQIKRGNAILSINRATRSLELMPKRGTNKKTWNLALLNRAAASEEEYMKNITLPLSQKEIMESDQRHVFRVPVREKKNRKNKKQLTK